MTLGTHTVITEHKAGDESSTGEHLPSTRQKRAQQEVCILPNQFTKITKV